MVLSDLVETQKVLQAYGGLIVDEMKDTLIRKGKDASGTLVNSISYTVELKGSTLELDFPMADYGYYVDKGRKPGKMPPISSIEAWTKIKGIPQSAAYPIARNIGKFGIKPTPFMDNSIEKYESGLIFNISVATAMDISNYMAKQISSTP